MPVDTQHPEYTHAKKRWELIRRIVNNDAQKYIRTVDIDDPERSKQYKEDAILINFTNLTRVGLTGLVFRKKLKVTLPEQINYLFDDVTGSGINLFQFSQHSVSEVLQLGRYGLLVDYYNEGERAYIKPYCAESIINWKTEHRNGKCVLTLLTLLEEKVKDDQDIFSQETEKQYRVLKLESSGVYTQSRYNERLELIEGPLPPQDYNGQYFDHIPFYFIGSENNDWVVDWQPLYDLAILDLGVYRNSADYEESIFICGQPYPVVAVGDTTPQEFLEVNPGGVLFGSRKMLVVANNGSAQLLQANANQLVAQAMKEKIEYAAKIGARLIESSQSTRETAEGAKIRYGSQHSALYTLTSNCSWGIENAIKDLCLFMGANANNVKFKLNDQFYDENADPNLIAQQIMLLDRGVIAKDDVREYGRKTGFIDESRTNEILEQESEMSDPLELLDDGSE